MKTDSGAGAAFLIGDCVDGRYTIERTLGAGPLGPTYRARHLESSQSVALKLLHDRAGDAFRYVWFERDAEAISGLSHPHIAAILDYGAAEGRRYVVSEWLDGESLEQRLQRGPLPLVEAQAIIRQVLAALAAVHRMRLAHGNIKPANVFLQRRKQAPERVKLVDFMLAPARPVAKPSVELGEYTAPEQGEGDMPDPCSDVYAVGVLLAEMLGLRSASAAEPATAAASPAPERGSQAVGVRASAPDRGSPAASPPAPGHGLQAAHSPALDRSAASGLAAAERGSAQGAAVAGGRVPLRERRRRNRKERRAARFGGAAALGHGAEAGELGVRAGFATLAGASVPARVGSMAARDSGALASVDASLAQAAAGRATAGVAAAVAGNGVAAAGAPAGEPATVVSRTPRDAPISATLRELIERAMAPERHRRFQDAADMLNELIDRLPRELRSPPEGSIVSGASSPGTRLSPLTHAGASQPPQVTARAYSSPPRAPSTPPRAAGAPPTPRTAPTLVAPLPDELRPAPAASAPRQPLVAWASPANPRLRRPPITRVDSLMAAGFVALGAGAVVLLLWWRGGDASRAEPARPLPRPIAAERVAAPHTETALAAATRPAPSAAPAGPSRAPVAPAPAVAPALQTSPAQPEATARNSAAPAAVHGESVEEQPVRAAPVPGEPPAAPRARATSALGANAALFGVDPAATPPADASPSTALAAPKPEPLFTIRSLRSPEARDPWRASLPPELKPYLALAVAGAEGNEAQIRDLRSYNYSNPEDPRGCLLLGRIYLNRLWRSDGVQQFSIAMQRDPSARGAPELLPILLGLVIQGKAGRTAEDFIVKVYGQEALPAVDAALSEVTNATWAERLHALSSRLTGD